MHWGNVLDWGVEDDAGGTVVSAPFGVSAVVDGLATVSVLSLVTTNRPSRPDLRQRPNQSVRVVPP